MKGKVTEAKFGNRMKLTAMIACLLVAWIYIKDKERKKIIGYTCNEHSEYRTAMLITAIMWPIMCWFLFPSMLLTRNKMVFGLGVFGPILYLGVHLPKAISARDRLRSAFGHDAILSMLALTTAYKGSGLHLRDDLMPMAIGGTCVLIMGAALFEGSEASEDESYWADGVGDSLRVGSAFTLFASVYGSIRRE